MVYDLVSRFKNLDDYLNGESEDILAEVLSEKTKIQLKGNLYIELYARITEIEGGSKKHLNEICFEVLSNVVLEVDSIPFPRFKKPKEEQIGALPESYSEQLNVLKALRIEEKHSGSILLNGSIDIGYRKIIVKENEEELKKIFKESIGILRETSNEALLNASSELLELSNIMHELVIDTFTPESKNIDALLPYNEREHINDKEHNDSAVVIVDDEDILVIDDDIFSVDEEILSMDEDDND